MTRFRYPAALAVTAFLALIGSIPLASQGGWFAPIFLVPLGVALWAWRVGTDVNTYGIRVRAPFHNQVVSWEEVSALGPDQRGGAIASLTDGRILHLTAVKAADLPRVLAASGMTPTLAGDKQSAAGRVEEAVPSQPDLERPTAVKDRQDDTAGDLR